MARPAVQDHAGHVKLSLFKSLLPALGIGLLVGLTAGLAAPLVGIGTGVFGVATFSSTAALIGGAVGFSLASTLLFGAPVPDVPGNLGRALENAADPEYPRRAIYGEFMVGSSWAWDHVFANGKTPDNGSHYALVSVIADHSIKGIVGVEIGEEFLRWNQHLVSNAFYGNSGAPDPSGRWYLPSNGQVYVPVPWSDWNQDFSETGRYLQTSANRIYEVVSGGVVSATEATDESGNNFTSGTATLRYHMTSSDPAKGYHAFYQGERDGPRVWHYAIDLQKGNQTSPNSWFTNRISEYAAHNRVLRGLAYVAEMFVAHPRIGFGGSIPDRRFRVEGKDDVWDPRGADGYHNNAVLVAADYLRWRFPGTITQNTFDPANISATADACDADIPGHPGKPKYTFDGVIEWSTDPGQALDMLCDHFRGGWFHRGDKILFWVGEAKASVGTLGPEHLVEGEEPIYQFERPPEERCNEVVAHYVQRNSSEADGQVWASKPAKKVTDAAFVANDNGVPLRKDIHMNGVTDVVRAKYHASIVLNKARREFTVNGAFAYMSLPVALEVGDCVDWNDPEAGINNRKVQVERKIEADQSGYILLSMREFGDPDYNNSPIDDQDVVGFGKRYSTEVPVVGQPTVTLVPDTEKVGKKGKMKATVAVTWPEVDRIWVAAGGKYYVRWALQGTSDFKTLTTDGHVLGVEIELKQGDWKFAVKAEDKFQNVSPQWSQNRDFTLNLTSEDLPGPPTSPDQEANILPNPKFHQSDVSAQTSVGWDLDDEDHLNDGAVTIVQDTTYPGVDGFSQHLLLLDTGSSTAGAAVNTGPAHIRFNPDDFVDVLPGELYYVDFDWSQVSSLLNGSAVMQLGMLFYQRDGTFVDFVQRHEGTATFSGSQFDLDTMGGFFQIIRGNQVRKCRPEILLRRSVASRHQVVVARARMRAVNRVELSRGQDRTVTDPTNFDFVAGMGPNFGYLFAPPRGSKYILEVFGELQSLTAGGTNNDTVDIRVQRLRRDLDANGDWLGTLTPVTAVFQGSIHQLTGSAHNPRKDFQKFLEDTPPTNVDANNYPYQYVYQLQARSGSSGVTAEFVDCGMKVAIQ